QGCGFAFTLGYILSPASRVLFGSPFLNFYSWPLTEWLMASVTVKTVATDRPPQVGEIIRVYGSVGAFVRSNLILIWVALVLLVWLFNPIQALPNPGEVGHAFRRMWNAEGSSGLVYNVYVTLKLNVVGLLYSSLISLLFAYLSVIPLFQPFNKLVQWLRYIPI